ncbi:MAG: ribulose-phosphate 3-epimerase, partial [Pyrinomonadaceae bacterium]
MIKFAPSILAADFLRLGDQIREAEDSGADRFQLDVMDGRFVPNISFGLPLVEAVRSATSALLEVHLMIVEPEKFIDDFARAGADLIIVHQESTPHLHRAIQQIKSLGKKAGVALNPATSLVTIEDVINDIDLALIMTVNPGFGGQSFIHTMLPKIERLKKLLEEHNQTCELEVDVGIDIRTAPLAAKAGATVM